MTAQSPEEAFHRLATMWSSAFCDWSHDQLFSEWELHEIENPWRTSRDVHKCFVRGCNLTASLEEFETVTGYSRRSWFSSIRWSETLTLGQFSVWLLDHCDLPDVRPLIIAGKVCEPGGIFIGMSEIVERETGNDRVRPSTHIADVLKFDQLLVVLWQTQVATGRMLPPKDSAMSPGCAAFLSTVFGAAAIIVGVQWPSNLLMLTGIGSMLTGIIVATFRQRTSLDAILPKEVTTFGDLARAFASKQPLEPTPA